MGKKKQRKQASTGANKKPDVAGAKDHKRNKRGTRLNEESKVATPPAQSGLCPLWNTRHDEVVLRQARLQSLWGDNLIFTVTDFLSVAECKALVAFGLSHPGGFEQAVQQQTKWFAHRNNGRLSFHDPAFASLMFQRLRPFVPECLSCAEVNRAATSAAKESRPGQKDVTVLSKEWPQRWTSPLLSSVLSEVAPSSDSTVDIDTAAAAAGAATTATAAADGTSSSDSLASGSPDDDLKQQQQGHSTSGPITKHPPYWRLHSVNPNIRLYQYTRKQRFGPHVDESVQSAPGQCTVYTLLVYLVGDGSARGTSETQLATQQQQQKHRKGLLGGKSAAASDDAEKLVGGETVFYDPSDKTRVVCRVAPRMGVALLHGHGNRCLLHEGAEVLAGVKYLLRSDVVYSLVDGQ